MSESKPKLSLEEGLRAWSDSAAVQHVDELDDYSAPPFPGLTKAPVNDLYFEKHTEWCRRRKPVEQRFISRLQAGEIIATGLAQPISVSSSRERIDPELWNLLKPDFRKSEARGPGLHIIQVEVEKPSPSVDRREAGDVPEPDVAEFTHNADYTRVKIREHEFNLIGGLQTLVKLLHEASQTSEPWQNGKKLMGLAKYGSTMTIGNAFRRHPQWRQLIEGNRRGLYRLNLKGLGPGNAY